MRPTFRAGRNIAMKVPTHEYDSTVAFHRDVLGLRQIAEPAYHSTDSVRFDFGGKVLWMDRVGEISQAEIQLEVITDDLDGASEYFMQHQCVRRDEIEALPEGFRGFWLSSPANNIHLVTPSDIA